MKFISWCVFIVSFMAVVPAGFAAISGFEDLDLADESYWNGSDQSGGFSSEGAFFSNTCKTLIYGFSLWEGWAYSNITDTTTAGYKNQYSAIPGTGADGTANYAIVRDILLYSGAGSPIVTFGKTETKEIDSAVIHGAYFTNTTFAYLAMLNGRLFLPAFDAGDWQMITITGIDANGKTTPNTVDFYLADYTSADPNEWYIVDEWTWVDLTSLGEIIGFNIDFFGSRFWVPPYVAMDELNTAPIPGTVWMLGFGLLGLFGFRKRRVENI